jgi:hypothetical protein
MLPSNAAKQPAVVCEAPLVFEYRAPIFYVFNPNTGARQAYTAEIFFATIAAAVECSRLHRPWDRPPAEVISMAEHQATNGKSSK